MGGAMRDASPHPDDLSWPQAQQHALLGRPLRQEALRLFGSLIAQKQLSDQGWIRIGFHAQVTLDHVSIRIPIGFPADDHGGLRISQRIANLGFIPIAAKNKVVSLAHEIHWDNVGIPISAVHAEARDAW
jgi:hypothetical protein